jgi:hypothetical protein
MAAEAVGMARPREEAKPRKTDGFWHLVRRVPKEFSSIDKRRFVTLTTGIAIVDDPKGVAAQRVVRELDDTLFAFWRERKAGRQTEAAMRYKQALKLSRQVGFPYRPNSELLVDVHGLVERLEALESRHGPLKKEEALAVVGAIARPEIMLSEMLEIYKELNVAQMAKRSPAQQRRWEVNRQTALDAFIAVIGGDRAMAKLDYETVMAVNAHVQKRIAAKEIVHDTGNKLIGRVAALWRDINRQKRLNLADCFSGTKIRGGEVGQRAAFPIEHVQDKILAPGMFDSLNDEARDLIYLVAETGMRPSEAVGLLPHHIVLNNKVPYVKIVAEDRVTKTKSAVREVPLVGLALQVMQRHPKGFPRYYDGAASLEALVSKAFRARGLILEDGQCFYSLRHTFENRLQGARAPEKVITFLMGHKWHREKYGKVPLEEKAYWVDRIKFVSPYAA